MKIGVLKEIKKDEYRVALTPQGAAQLVRDGHSVLVETNAGAGNSGFADSGYPEAAVVQFARSRRGC